MATGGVPGPVRQRLQSAESELDSESEQKRPMMPSVSSARGDAGGDTSDAARQHRSLESNERIAAMAAEDREPSVAPTGILAWIGFGCTLFGLACLCISFASPYWLQTYPNSFNQFKNLGLWEVCFQNYMHHKDDSQELYNECWWMFNTAPRFWKLREWLLPPWFISVQVMVSACLLLQVINTLIVACVFLHFCPIMNHEYLQTYAMFSASAISFLCVMMTFIAASVFGSLSEDRLWMPRPDMNFLSWGFGFYIIFGIAALAAGSCLFLAARQAYADLLQREDEFDKMAHELSGYPASAVGSGSGYAPSYAGGGGSVAGAYSPSSQLSYGPPGYAQAVNPPPMGGAPYGEKYPVKA